MGPVAKVCCLIPHLKINALLFILECLQVNIPVSYMIDWLMIFTATSPSHISSLYSVLTFAIPAIMVTLSQVLANMFTLSAHYFKVRGFQMSASLALKK